MIFAHPVLQQLRYLGLWGAGIWLLAFAAVLYAAMAVVYQSHEVRKEYAKLQALQEERARLLDRRAQLLVERSMLRDPARVEQLASVELNMHFPPLERGERGERGAPRTAAIDSESVAEASRVAQP